MITIVQARSKVLGRARRVSLEEEIQVGDAAGRILSRPVEATKDLPPFDRVMMDGYAVRSKDVHAGVVLPVVGEVAAGDVGDHFLDSGQAQEIMTGAPLPPGADAVVPIEWTESSEGEVKIDRALDPGRHVAPRGEDLSAGQPIARAGDRVSEMNLSLLIASGVSHVSVIRRPSISILTSGNELVPPGAPLRRGQIWESNGPSLSALFASTGAEVRNLGIVGDSREDLDRAMATAIDSDVVVLTGGSSVGKYDLAPEVVEATGAEQHFARISVKPGKPTLFYTRGSTLIFCLPGNPVAALMTGRVLVAPALAFLGGDLVEEWPDSTEPLLCEIGRHPKRDLLLPVHRTKEGLTFNGWHGSGDVTCLAGANAFAFVTQGEEAAPIGTPVPVFPLPGELSW